MTPLLAESAAAARAVETLRSESACRKKLTASAPEIGRSAKAGVSKTRDDEPKAATSNSDRALHNAPVRIPLPGAKFSPSKIIFHERNRASRRETTLIGAT